MYLLDSTYKNKETLTGKIKIGFFPWVQSWIMRKRESARVAKELNAMSDRDLADLGLSRWDIEDVAKGRWRRA